MKPVIPCWHICLWYNFASPKKLPPSKFVCWFSNGNYLVANKPLGLTLLSSSSSRTSVLYIVGLHQFSTFVRKKLLLCPQYKLNTRNGTWHLPNLGHLLFSKEEMENQTLTSVPLGWLQKYIFVTIQWGLSACNNFVFLNSNVVRSDRSSWSYDVTIQFQQQSLDIF